MLPAGIRTFKRHRGIVNTHAHERSTFGTFAGTMEAHSSSLDSRSSRQSSHSPSTKSLYSNSPPQTAQLSKTVFLVFRVLLCH